MELASGGNEKLSSSSITVEVKGNVDLTALVVSENGKVDSDADMVFFNQLKAPGLELDGKTLSADLQGLRNGGAKIIIAASPETDGATFASISGLSISVSVNGVEEITFTPSGLTSETVAVLLEIYSNKGTWKARAVGQGYDNGLGGLARDFGISVDSEESTPPVEAAAPAPAPISLAKKRVVDLEKRLETQNPAMLSLVKAAGVSLAKQGLSEHTARVVLCLDISASMSDEFSSGAVQKLIERVLALALRFDDDGQVEVYLFGDTASRFGTLDLTSLPNFANKTLAGGWRYGTKYGEVLKLVREDHRNADPNVPTYVMFVTDGATQDKKKTEELIREFSAEAVFIQFMGIGHENSNEFVFLQKLDDLKGRVLDNADFFALEAHRLAGHSAISDDELFGLLTKEYPLWVKAAQNKGMIPQ